MKLLGTAAIVFILNIPFGYWRARAKRFSPQWFLSIHLPVPFIIMLRIVSGLGWQLLTFPVLVGVFFSGQFVGGRLQLRWSRKAKVPPSACLIWDLVRRLQAH